MWVRRQREIGYGVLMPQWESVWGMSGSDQQGRKEIGDDIRGEK